jgi:hypothetical protein
MGLSSRLPLSLWRLHRAAADVPIPVESGLSTIGWRSPRSRNGGLLLTS